MTLLSILPKDSNPDLRKACAKLEKDLKAKKIDKKRLDEELCYVSLMYCMADLTYKEMPKQPEAYRKYLRLSDEEKTEFNNRKHNVWQDETTELGKFFKTRDSIRSENRSSFLWLKFMLDNLPEGDLMNRGKVNELVVLYEAHGFGG